MMKRFVFLAALSLLAGLLIFAAGCSDDNTSTGSGGVVGDTSDASFQAAVGIFEDAQVDDAFDNTEEVSISLLDTEFPNWDGVSSPLRSRRQSSAADSIAVIVSNYTYQNGWHIFTFSATMIVGVDTAASVSGTDSIRVMANGQALNPPDSTVDELNIRAHFDVSAVGDSGTFTGQGDHSLDLNLNAMAEPPTLTINADIAQSMQASIDVNGGTDSAGTCDLSVSFTQITTNAVLPMDSTGEPMDCPLSGARTTTAMLSLSCNSQTSLDSLNIDGTWTITETVQANGDVKIDYTDGTTTWSVTEPCDPNPPMAVRGWQTLH